jgi:hypothetical protein
LEANVQKPNRGKVLRRRFASADTRHGSGALFVSAALCCGMLLASAFARPLCMVSAQEASVPAPMQAQLLATVAPYDRNMTARAGAVIKVLVLTKPGDGDSARAAKQLLEALGRLPQIGGLPHTESTLAFVTAAKLASACREQHVSIVFVTPGLAAHVTELAGALVGADVLTVGSNADYVANGIVLGFDVVSGKPKLLVNLTQARKQHVAFNASVLKMMKVFE